MSYDPVKHKKLNAARRQKVIETTFDHYGRICVGCGEDDPDTLTLDHKNNDGAAHRRSEGRCGTPELVYREWLKTGFWRTDIQTLCAN